MDEPPFCVPRDSDGRLERRGGALSRSAPARLHRRSRSSDSGWIRSWTRIVIDAARRLLGLGAEAQERLVGMPDCDSPGGHAVPGLGEASHRPCPSPAPGFRWPRCSASFSMPS